MQEVHDEVKSTLNHRIEFDVWADDMNNFHIAKQLVSVSACTGEDAIRSYLDQNGLNHAVDVVKGKVDSLKWFAAPYSAGVLLCLTTFMSHLSMTRGNKASFLRLFTSRTAVKMAGLEYRLRRYLREQVACPGLASEVTIEMLPADAAHVWNARLVDCICAAEIVLTSSRYTTERAMHHMLALMYQSKHDSFVSIGAFSNLPVAFPLPELEECSLASPSASTKLQKCPPAAASAPIKMQKRRSAAWPTAHATPEYEIKASAERPPALHPAVLRWKRAIRMQIKQNRLCRTRTAMNRVDSRKRAIIRERRHAKQKVASSNCPTSSRLSQTIPKKKATLQKERGASAEAKVTSRKLIALESILAQADIKREKQQREDALRCEMFRCLRVADDMMHA
jgi:hypothetical protein